MNNGPGRVIIPVMCAKIPEVDGMNAAMRAWLDAPMDRRGTHCEKWDGLKR